MRGAVSTRFSSARPEPAPAATPVAPVPAHRTVVIGLVGGIASGKSTVARLFGELGLTVVDADQEARAVVERPEVAAALRARFGATVFTADGRLDRAALARRVFADPADLAALEAITHPTIRAALLERIAAARAAGRSVVLDAPLLLESGLVDVCDACLFVEAPTETRAARAAARGWPSGELERREARQAPLHVKKARCVDSIRNDRPLEDVRRQVAAVLAQVVEPPGTSSAS
jgi:dephospho-CoA kinase